MNKSIVQLDLLQTKRCSTCGRALFLLDFYTDKRRKDGRYRECKTCVAQRRKAGRGKEREREKKPSYRARRYKWNREHREVMRLAQRQYRERQRACQERLVV